MKKFFQKINKTDKPLVKLVKRREDPNLKKRDEKGDSITNTNEIEKITRKYFENLILQPRKSKRNG
jgi:hypothetical protein